MVNKKLRTPEKIAMKLLIFSLLIFGFIGILVGLDYRGGIFVIGLGIVFMIIYIVILRKNKSRTTKERQR